MLQNTCIIITENVNGGQVLNVRTDRQIQQVRHSRPISTHSLPHLQTMLLHCRARGLACPYAMECKDRTARLLYSVHRQIYMSATVISGVQQAIPQQEVILISWLTHSPYNRSTLNISAFSNKFFHGTSCARR